MTEEHNPFASVTLTKEQYELLINHKLTNEDRQKLLSALEKGREILKRMRQNEETRRDRQDT